MGGRKNRGYSFIELLSVVVLVGIVSAMAFPLNSFLLNRPGGERVADGLDQIRMAALDYYYDTGTFPSDDSTWGVNPFLNNPFAAVDCAANPSNLYCLWNGPYLLQFPSPPPGYSTFRWNNQRNWQKAASPGEISVSTSSGSIPEILYLARP